MNKTQYDVEFLIPFHVLIQDAATADIAKDHAKRYMLQHHPVNTLRAIVRLPDADPRESA